MKKILAAVAALLFLAGAAGAADGPLAARWATCGIGGSGTASFQGLATDKAGNLYAAGTLSGEVVFAAGISATAGRLTAAAVLVKYGPSGKVLWARAVTGASGYSTFSGVALDAAGNAYVAGGIGYGKYDLDATIQAVGVYAGSEAANMILAKYDPSGKPLWARTLPKKQGASFLSAVAVDGAGGIYAGGYVQLDPGGQVELSNKAPSFAATPKTFGAYSSPLLLKYDTAGRVMWVAGASSNSGTAELKAIAVDGTNSVVVIGRGFDGPFDLGSGTRVDHINSILLAKYDPAGKAKWAKTIFAESGDFQARSLCTDSKGGIYASGQFYGSGTESDLYLALGNEVTIRDVSQPGWSVLAKWDASGTPQWAARVATFPSEIRGIAADGTSVYVSGGVYRGPEVQSLDFGNGVVGRAQPTWGTADFLTAYDLSGAARWTVMPPVQGESKAELDLLLSDGKGKLFAAGLLKGQQPADFGEGIVVSSSSTSASVLAASYALQAGTTSAAASPRQPPGTTAAPTISASGLPGSIDTAAGLRGLAPLFKGARGAPLQAQWAKGGATDSYGNEAAFFRADADAAGNVYVVGTAKPGVPYNLGDGVSLPGVAVDSAMVVKYTPSGKTLWAWTASKGSAASRFSSVAADAAGNVYALGGMEKGSIAFSRNVKLDTPKTGKPILVKFDASGAPQWIQTIDARSTPYYTSVAISKDGSIYVAASDCVAKVDASGKVLWTEKIEVVDKGEPLYTRLVVDDAGNVFALGLLSAFGTFDFGNGVSLKNKGYHGNTVIVKYDSAGVAQWVTGIESEWPGIQFLGQDKQGNLFAAGYVKGMYDDNFGNGVRIVGQQVTNAQEMLVVVKFDSTGAAQWERHLESASGLFDFRAAAIDDTRVYIAGTVFKREGTIGYATGDPLIDFLAVYDLSGELKWMAMPPWDIGKAAIGSLSAAGNGNLVMTAHLGWGGGLDLGNRVTVEGGNSSVVVKYKVGDLAPAGH